MQGQDQSEQHKSTETDRWSDLTFSGVPCVNTQGAETTSACFGLPPLTAVITFDLEQ